MKHLLKNPFFIYGNLFYLFLFLGFVLYTDVHPIIFNKYSWHYIEGLLVQLIFWVPYELLLLFLINTSIQIKISKKTYKLGILLRLGVVLFMLCSMFLGVELALRMYPKPKVEDFHPFLQAMSTKKNEADWHVNSDNFRYDEITKEKPKDTYRVFITGGSTVFDEWQAYDNTLVKQVENLLRSHYPNRKIQVINAGYLRYTSEHTLILYATKLSDYHPDLIVTWQGFNDLYYSCTPPYLSTGQYKGDYSHFYAVLANVVNDYFNFQPHLYTLDLLHKVFTEKFYGDLQPYLPHSTPPLTAKPVAMEFQSLAAYTRNTTDLVRLVKADNVSILLGNQASMWNKKNKQFFGLGRAYCTINGTYPSDDSFIKGMARFNQASRQIAEENQVPFVDIDSQLPKTPVYMYDDVHYTAKGDTLVAQIIYKAIVKNKFLEDQPTVSQ